MVWDAFLKVYANASLTIQNASYIHDQVLEALSVADEWSEVCSLVFRQSLVLLSNQPYIDLHF